MVGVPALALCAANLLNAVLVRRFGLRRLSHGAVIGYVAWAGVHSVLALTGMVPLWAFLVLQAGSNFLFGFVAANFSTMAMGPVGHIAGTASAMLGFSTIVGGAVVGTLIGQAFDGSVAPLALGSLICGGAAVAVVLWAEKGRLMQPIEAEVA